MIKIIQIPKDPIKLTQYKYSSLHKKQTNKTKKKREIYIERYFLFVCSKKIICAMKFRLIHK